METPSTIEIFCRVSNAGFWFSPDLIFTIVLQAIFALQVSLFKKKAFDFSYNLNLFN